jgi:hypothetical protein
MSDADSGDDVARALHAQAVQESSIRMIPMWADVLERLGAKAQTMRDGDNSGTANTLTP